MYEPFSYSLFRTGFRGVLLPGSWISAQKSLDTHHDLVVSQYRARPGCTVSSTCLLSRLLKNIPILEGSSARQQYDAVQQYGLRVAGNYGITTYMHSGIGFFGEMLGVGAEYFVATDYACDPDEIATNWRKISAVTPLTHAKSDLDLFLPNSEDSSNESGLTIYEVHVAALSVQYQSYVKHCLANNGNPTAMDFIAHVVLPNTLRKHLALAVINRFYKAWWNDRSVDNVCYAKRNFQAPSIDHLVDPAWEKAITLIKRSSKSFDHLLSMTPNLSGASTKQWLMKPDIYETPQNTWLLLAARLKHFAFLCDAAGDGLLRVNGEIVDHFRMTMRSCGHYKQILANLDVQSAEECQRYVDLIESKSGRKIQ